MVAELEPFAGSNHSSENIGLEEERKRITHFSQSQCQPRNQSRIRNESVDPKNGKAFESKNESFADMVNVSNGDSLL